MGRIARLTIVFATVSLPWFAPPVCRAQSSASPPSTARVVQQSTTKTASSDEARPVRNPTTKVPPPRAWTNAKPSGKPVASIPPPRTWTRPDERRPPAACVGFGRDYRRLSAWFVCGRTRAAAVAAWVGDHALAADSGRPDEGPAQASTARTG